MVQENTLDKPIIIICGPTASGKSSLAVDLACKIQGAVISADSMQVYREFDLGTAKITVDEAKGIPHYMIDVVSPEDEYSVALYKEQANEAIESIHNLNKCAIVTGGTGLYIDSLINSYNYGKIARNNELRESLFNEAAIYGNEYVYNKLVKLIPDTRIHMNNVKRVIRAIEIALSDNSQEDINVSIRPHIMIGLRLDRETLYNRINRRVDSLIEKGLVQEVKSLSNNYSFDIQPMQAIGYKEFKDYFLGNMDLVSTIELIKKNTRNYAKRQMTWFRKYPDIKWFNPESERDLAIDYIINSYELQ